MRRDEAAERVLWTALGLLFARGVLGFIFLMAGVWKVFDLGPVGHVRRYFLPYTDTFLPDWSLWVVGLTIPFVELLAGVLVLLGLWRRWAYIALGTLLVTVTFGHLLKEPLHSFHQHVIPRLALLLLVLLMPAAADSFSLDEWLRRRTSRWPQ